MSYLAADLHGICGMMPAFATADAGDMTATDTIDVGHLQAGLDRAIKDGVHWLTLCEKYRPEVEAKRAVGV